MKRPALSAPDERILLALGRMHYLTNEQLRRLYYGQSLSYVQERTRNLSQLGYLLRIELKSARRGGSSPIVYALDKNGRSFVQEAGYDLAPRFRKSEILAASPLHLEHTLAVNDVLIAFEQLDGRLLSTGTSGISNGSNCRSTLMPGLRCEAVSTRRLTCWRSIGGLKHSWRFGIR